MNVPRLLADRYLILEQLAAEADGDRYKARDARLDRLVEVLVLRAEAGSEAAARRLAAARQAASLLHPNIVRIYDAAEDGPVAYIVSDSVEGGTLAQSLVRGHPYRPEIPAALARDIAAALAEAHGRGLVHGDLTPTCVRLTQEGRACVEGFCSERATAPTPWLAPEIAAGGPLSPEGDLYSLGAILYSLLTGYPPRPVAQPLPPGIPDSLRRLTAALLSPIPEQRPDAVTAGAELQGTIADATRTTGTLPAAGMVTPRPGLPRTSTPSAPARPVSTPAPRASPTPAASVLQPPAPAPTQGRRWWLALLAGALLLLAAALATQILRGPAALPLSPTPTPFFATGVTVAPTGAPFHRAGRVDAIEGQTWTVEGQAIQVPFAVSNNPRPGVKATVDGIVRPDGQWVATRLTWEP